MKTVFSILLLSVLLSQSICSDIDHYVSVHEHVYRSLRCTPKRFVTCLRPRGNRFYYDTTQQQCLPVPPSLCLSGVHITVIWENGFRNIDQCIHECNPQIPSLIGGFGPQTYGNSPLTNFNNGLNMQTGLNFNQGRYTQPGHNFYPGANAEPGYNFNQGSNAQPGYNFNQGGRTQPGHNLNQGSNAQPGHNFNQAGRTQPGHNFNQGGSTQPGYNLNQGENQQPGYNSNQGGIPQPGHNLNQGGNLQPGHNFNHGKSTLPEYNFNQGENKQPGYNSYQKENIPGDNFSQDGQPDKANQRVNLQPGHHSIQGENNSNHKENRQPQTNLNKEEIAYNSTRYHNEETTLTREETHKKFHV